MYFASTCSVPSIFDILGTTRPVVTLLLFPMSLASNGAWPGLQPPSLLGRVSRVTRSVRYALQQKFTLVTRNEWTRTRTSSRLAAHTRTGCTGCNEACLNVLALIVGLGRTREKEPLYSDANPQFLHYARRRTEHPSGSLPLLAPLGSPGLCASPPAPTAGSCCSVSIFSCKVPATQVAWSLERATTVCLLSHILHHSSCSRITKSVASGFRPVEYHQRLGIAGTICRQLEKPPLARWDTLVSMHLPWTFSLSLLPLYHDKGKQDLPTQSQGTWEDNSRKGLPRRCRGLIVAHKMFLSR